MHECLLLPSDQNYRLRGEYLAWRGEEEYGQTLSSECVRDIRETNISFTKSAYDCKGKRYSYIISMYIMYLCVIFHQYMYLNMSLLGCIHGKPLKTPHPVMPPCARQSDS